MSDDRDSARRKRIIEALSAGGLKEPFEAAKRFLSDSLRNAVTDEQWPREQAELSERMALSTLSVLRELVDEISPTETVSAKMYFYTHLLIMIAYSAGNRDRTTLDRIKPIQAKFAENARAVKANSSLPIKIIERIVKDEVDRRIELSPDKSLTLIAASALKEVNRRINLEKESRDLIFNSPHYSKAESLERVYRRIKDRILN